MFRVSTVHLSADAATASPELDPAELGEISEAGLVALLERFQALDPLQVVAADPQLLVVARAGRFIVRTGRGRLFLYDARDSAQPGAELTPAEIVAQLGRSGSTPATAADEPVPAGEAPAKPPLAPHRGIAVAILATGLALNGYTLYSVFYTESVNAPTAVRLLTDPDELGARQRSVLGTYATGDKPGDRTITVLADGHVKFAEIGVTNAVLNNTDTYRIGRRADKFCLQTVDSGTIDIFDTDTLVYYRDLYRRK